MTCNVASRIARKARAQAEARGEADGRALVSASSIASVAAIRSVSVRLHAEGHAFGYGYTTLEAPALREAYLESFHTAANEQARFRRAAAATCRAIAALRANE